MDQHDYGPDPHLNERGVRLSRRQRRTLAVVGLLIGIGLALVVVGIAYGLPPQWAGSASRYRAVAEGSGRAVVSVIQDGVRLEGGEVDLPHSVPVDGDVVVIQVRRSATSAGRDLGCAVTGGAVRSSTERRIAGGVECEAVLSDP